MRSGKKDVHVNGSPKVSGGSVNPPAKVSSRSPRTAILVLGLLLIGFVLLQCLLPLRTAIKIGADEDFEYAKATLWLKGYHFYTEVWNNQPLLHTFWITQVLKHVSPSVLGPRLVTSAFTLLLLSSVFLVSRCVHGLGVAALTTALLITSPGFLELASSCMVEIPSLAPVVVALAVLVVGPRGRLRQSMDVQRLAVRWGDEPTRGRNAGFIRPPPARVSPLPDESGVPIRGFAGGGFIGDRPNN